MRRIYRLIWVVFLVVFLMAGRSFGQQTSPGPKIVLEDEEITLMENGKEIKKIYVRKSGEEEQAIIKEVEAKVFNKLGVQSYKEVSDRKIQEQYNKELAMLMKIRKLDQPKLRFLDEKGNAIKEISLISEKTKTKVKDDWKKREWEGEKISVKIPRISEKGKFVVLSGSVTETPLPTAEYLHEYKEIGYIPTASISLYDSKGDVLFEKVFPRGTEIVGTPELIVSDNGVVAIILGSAANPESENILHVYNSGGVEILSYPNNESENVYPDRILAVSQNGRYLAVRVTFYHPEPSLPVFFDLEKSAFWKSNKNYGIRAITDDGVVKATYRDPSDKKTVKVEINLSDVLGGAQK